MFTPDGIRINFKAIKPAGFVPPDDILLPGQQKDAKVPSPSGGHILLRGGGGVY